MSELIKSLIAARKEMGAAKKGKDNPFFKSKYADLASVMEAVKEPLDAHGLQFVQDIQDQCVVTVIMHESGETMRLAPVPILAAKQDAQGIGSAITYASRYSLRTALGVPSIDDDAEAAVGRGNAASAKKFPSPVTSALEGVQVDPAKVEAVANALIDLHAASEAGEDTGYQAFETAETLDSDTKLAVWGKLAQHTKVRSWIKKVTAEHRK